MFAFTNSRTSGTELNILLPLMFSLLIEKMIAQYLLSYG